METISLDGAIEYLGYAHPADIVGLINEYMASNEISHIKISGLHKPILIETFMENPENFIRLHLINNEIPMKLIEEMMAPNSEN